MKEPRWLLLDAVKAVHQMLIAHHGGVPGIREVHLLESALYRPQQLIAYGDDCTIPGLAAAYCYGLARNHPFVDGNKRIALTAAAMFLDLNGHTLNAPEADAVVMIERLAGGKVDEKDLIEWFAANTKAR